MTRRSIILPAIGFLTIPTFISVSLLAQHAPQRGERPERPEMRERMQQMHQQMMQRGHHMGETSPDSGIFKPDDLRWRRGPESLPRGAEYVLLEGDPSRPAPFTMRIKMPDGYRIPPHWHPVHERVTVISGSFHLGHGERFDAQATQALGAGSYFSLPPKSRHFAYAKGETIVQLNSIGPWEIHYVNPGDDPRKGQTRRDRPD
jgi:hypothetical protein